MAFAQETGSRTHILQAKVKKCYMVSLTTERVSNPVEFVTSLPFIYHLWVSPAVICRR